ncbi:MAG: hypothetical protein ACOYXB_14820 [Bacteroidota bacterium]
MTAKGFSGELGAMISRARTGRPADVDYLMSGLTGPVCFAMTRYVDYALGLVSTAAGIRRIEYYLFHGTPIQRNYASLFFNRRGDWKVVKEAFDRGLIDEIQAFAR